LENDAANIYLILRDVALPLLCRDEPVRPCTCTCTCTCMERRIPQRHASCAHACSLMQHHSFRPGFALTCGFFNSHRIGVRAPEKTDSPTRRRFNSFTCTSEVLLFCQGGGNSFVYSWKGRFSLNAPSCCASKCMSYHYQKERQEMCSRISTHMHSPGKWGPYSRCLNGLCEAPECAVCAARGCGARSDAAGGLECAPKDLIPGRNMLTERYARPLGTRCKKTETRFADCERPWEVWGYMLAQLLPVRPSKTDQ